MSYTLEKIRKEVKQKLRNVQNDKCDFDTDYIISEVTNIPKLEFFLNAQNTISSEDEEVIFDIVDRRLQEEPLQYIFQKAYFRNLSFKVGSGVLIPRPETEILVDFVLDKLPKNGKVCDIGTGSGAISVSIAFENKTSEVLGVDISETALDYAKFNKEKYNLTNLKLLKSDLFTSIPNQKFDFITANLPYISEKEYKTLDCEVCNFEPKLALTANNEGLELIQKVAMMAGDYLIERGFIIFEIGHTQADKVKEILSNIPNWANISSLKDYNKIERFIIAQKVNTKDRYPL